MFSTPDARYFPPKRNHTGMEACRVLTTEAREMQHDHPPTQKETQQAHMHKYHLRVPIFSRGPRAHINTRIKHSLVRLKAREISQAMISRILVFTRSCIAGAFAVLLQREVPEEA